MTKLKWLWIKFWGYRYIIISPTNRKEYILYRHRYFDKKQWDDFFMEG